MRISVKFHSDKNIVLPKHHNHILQATILNYLGNKDYQEFIHDEGFQNEKRTFKLYTFSRLQGEFKVDNERDKIIYKNNAELLISSVDENLIKYFINGAIKKDKINLGGNLVDMEEVKIINKKFKPGDKFFTKSAITAYSTFSNGDKKKTFYYHPNEEEFGEIIRNNLLKKYKAYYGSEPENSEFSIKLALGKKPKDMWFVYKGFKIKAWHGEFILDGSQELVTLAYDVGLGSKNSQGFGCVEVCD
jgi:CRISPR-associated endoribonuclease Cas6